MAVIKDRIKELRKESGYTQESLAKALGLNAKSSIANYENGSNAPSDDIKLKMCDLFNVSIDYLMGKTNIRNEGNLFVIPVLGKIAAGQPILAEEYLEGYLPVDPNIYGMTTPDDYFYLKVSGESMNLKVHNGDYALIHKQDYAENGDIIVAIVNGDDEATMKKYEKLNEQFVLLKPMSTDPTIEMITVDLKQTKFKIIGKAIGQFGKF